MSSLLLRRAGSAALAIGLLSACSLLVVGSDVQCQNDGDCGKLAAGATCSADKVCVGGGVGGACKVNADCPDQNGGPALCRKSDHTCVALLSQDCPRILAKGAAAVKNDDAIILGTIFSLKGVNQASGVARTNSAELAASEIEENIVGLPGGTGGKPRPLVFVACDDSSDNTIATRAAQHLKDVGAPALIGPGGSGLVTAAAQNATIPGGMFLITPSATSTSLSAFNNLVWRTAPSDVLQAVALRDQINALETKFKVDNPAVTKVKLTIVYQNNTYGSGLLDAMTKTLLLNGKPFGDPSNVGFATPITYDATTLDPTAAAGQVTTDKPHLIVLVGTSEIITKFLVPVEANWPASGTPRPLYLLADAARKQEALDAAKASDPLRVRIRGTVPGTSNALFSAFNVRYQGKYSATASTFGMAGAYDSVYLLLYGMASIGAQPITGASLATSMAKMMGGTKIDVGPDGLKTAMPALGSGNAIDITGASGPLDFDLVAHEAQSDIDVWCIGKDGTGATIFSSSGRFYDATKTQMTGVVSCP